MKLLVLSCAEDEFAEAVDYYNDQCPGLGYEFAAEVQRAFERIRNHPRAWPKFSARTRRCLTDRFPFGVLYATYEERIIIGGIMHLKVNPGRWQNRVAEAFGEQASASDG
jgi:hypothetical protein